MTDTRDSKPTPPFALYALGAYTLAMLALVIYQGNLLYHTPKDSSTAQYQHAYLIFWAVCNLLIGAGGLFYLVFPRPVTETSADATAPTKMLILAVGGLFGLSLTVLGIMFGLLWWDVSTGGLFSGRDAWKGGPTWEHWRPYIVLGLILGGLAIMLFSILIVRTEERTNPTLRRLVYGYVSVFTGLMVLAVLGALNVLAFFYVQENGLDPFDWTETHIYSISNESKRVLKSLETPVMIYAVLPPGDGLTTDVKTLLNNFKSVTKKVQYEMVDPSNPLETNMVSELFDKYGFSERDGVIVVYDPGGSKVNFHILKTFPDLEEVSPARMQGRETQRSFKGEKAIISAIQSLRDGKVQNVVYFTQDSGELALEDFTASKLDIGLGRLSSQLKQDKVYDPKPLNLEAEGKVPADAFCVVIAGPQQELTPPKIDVLREYMKRKEARLIVLVDVSRDREPLKTGLESFLTEYGVQVGQDLILNGLQPRQPTATMVTVAPAADPSFAEPFAGLLFSLPAARSVKPLPGGGSYTAQSLLQTYIVPGQRYQWAEEKPKDVLGNQEEFDKKARTRVEPVSVAVTVREKQAASPDPHAQGDPRLVVFGDASFVSNAAIGDQRVGPVYGRLFTSALSWLRSRPEDIAVAEAKVRKSYRATISPDKQFTLQVIPGALLVLAILGCGAGVWIMRRR